MKENRFYKIAFIAMFTLNLLVLSFMFFSKPQRIPLRGNRPGRAANFQHAKKTMQLDDKQYEKFKDLAKQHGQKMISINKKQKSLLVPLFNQIEGNVDSLRMQKLGALEQEKIKVTLDHFQDIKSILREEQYDGFNSFKKKVSIILLSNGKKRPHPH